MAGYLEGYGAGEERRDKLIKGTLIAIAAVIVLGTLLFFTLRNQSGRSRLDDFVELLKKKDYKGAYVAWGCTEQSPCRDYSYERFLRDWGPESPAANAASARVERSASCGGIVMNTGLLRVYHFDPDYSVNLWYEKKDGQIGFAPFIGRMQCTILP